MPLVPIGLQMQAWSKAIDSADRGGQAGNIFTKSTGNCIFHEVATPRYKEKNLKIKGNDKDISNLVSPLRPIIDQNKEREKRSDPPENSSLSLDVAGTSQIRSIKPEKKKKQSNLKKLPAKKKKIRQTQGKAEKEKKSRIKGIKKAQNKRNAQSTSRATGKNS